MPKKKKDKVTKIRIARMRSKNIEKGGENISGTINSETSTALQIIKDHIEARDGDATKIEALREAVNCYAKCIASKTTPNRR